MKSFAFLMLKTVFASISRVLLLSAWLYVTNNGEFSSLRTFFGYYLTVLVLVIFHFFFNKMRPSCSSSYWIGLLYFSTFISLSQLYIWSCHFDLVITWTNFIQRYCWMRWVQFSALTTWTWVQCWKRGLKGRGKRERMDPSTKQLSWSSFSTVS